jgi:DNA-directed RNA polymerase specialized sigma24 family protein
MARNLRRRLAPEVRVAIVSRYAAGESAKALSQDYAISRDGVRRLLKRAGVAIRTQSVITPQVTQQIVRLYESGLTIRQVAAQVGCAYGTVRGVLHENDAEVRASPVGRRAAPSE